MKADIAGILAESALFRGLTHEEIKEILLRFPRETVAFKKHENIFNKGEKERKIGFVTSGKCSVVTASSSSPAVRLRALQVGDSFGFLSVFCPNVEFPTDIIAAEPTEVVFFGKEEIMKLIHAYPKFAENTVLFLADRVSFLNLKLRSFCEPNAERKLASYLLLEASRLRTDILPFSATKICGETGIPRPSLYRAADALEKLSLIHVENKTVTVKADVISDFLGR